MANDVTNVISICPSIEHQEAVETKLAALAEKFEAGRAPCEPRTRFESFDGEELRFVSAWGPDFDFQHYLVRALATVDPGVTVTNCYEQEFLEAVGARVAWLHENEIKFAEEDGDLSYLNDESLDDVRGQVVHLFQEKCAFEAASKAP